jgi:hypothetical protein
MTTLLIILFVLSVVVVIGLVFLDVRSKRLLAAFYALFFCLPLLLGSGIYLAREPIQQGHLLSRLGPLLSLVWPPDDLYTPLAEEQLVSAKRTYFMHFAHKYVGNHGIEIVMPAAAPVGTQGQIQLSISAKFFHANKIVFQSDGKDCWPFWGINSHGFGFVRYTVPSDLPVREPLDAEITVQGDIELFLRETGVAMIQLVKMSDE